MLTKTLYITDCSDFDVIEVYQHEYTKLFYKLYNNAELMADDDFVKSSLNQYIDKSIYDVCVSQVKTKLKQHETSIDKKLKQIDEIYSLLNTNEFKTKKEKRHKFNLINKLFRLNRNIDKNITFGGKALLRTITKQQIRLKQLNKQLNQTNDFDELINIQNQIDETSKLVNKNKTKFTENRKIGFSFIGRANEKGNRKFSFDLNNNIIIFKPNKSTKVELKFTYRDKQTKQILSKLQELTENKEIPLTVSIVGKHIHISYDNEYVNGYSFNSNECKKEQQIITDKDKRKEIYIKYKGEQEDNKKINKIENRYLSVDLNPNYIGISIFDSCENNIGNIIHTELIDLSRLNIRLGKSSNHNKQLRQNNKRKFEISQIWKYIFKLVEHYKVYNFIMEDLDFKENNKESKGTGFNRLTKNLWNRGLIEQLINKYCENMGLNKVEVNPIYSSFIGNMIYSYADPVSASLEIGRRGVVKYIKGGSIYPRLSLINQEKLDYLLGENVDIEWGSWKQLYQHTSLLRYRNPHDGLKAINLGSYKSKCLRLLT